MKDGMIISLLDCLGSIHQSQEIDLHMKPDLIEGIDFQLFL